MRSRDFLDGWDPPGANHKPTRPGQLRQHEGLAPRSGTQVEDPVTLHNAWRRGTMDLSPFWVHRVCGLGLSLGAMGECDDLSIAEGFKEAMSEGANSVGRGIRGSLGRCAVSS